MHGIFVCIAWSRQAWWSSGYPQLLLALVLESDSHRGEILTLFAEMQKEGPITESA